jgi:hypothetical protein
LDFLLFVARLVEARWLGLRSNSRLPLPRKTVQLGGNDLETVQRNRVSRVDRGEKHYRLSQRLNNTKPLKARFSLQHRISKQTEFAKYKPCGRDDPQNDEL